MPSHTDEERRQWVLNDDGLRDLQRKARDNIREWVKKNRQLIDEVIDNVSSGKKQAHYLKYER
jgi:hypothetical protein